MNAINQDLNKTDRKKSWITETHGMAVLSTGSWLGVQIIKGGVDGISEVALTAFVSAVFTVVMQVVYKVRNGHKIKYA